jgi:hypothetical protein
MNRVCDDQESGQALFVVHVPAERGEEGAKESANAEVRTPNCRTRVVVASPNAAPSDRGRGGQARMTNCQTGAVQNLDAELFFFVVAGEEDPMVLAESV